MLADLEVRNYAIIDNTEISFESGFNAITGETGAGKSLLVDALSLALGYRSSASAIRTGENKASVKALFYIPSMPDKLKVILEDNAVDFDDGSLLLFREIYANGRNVCKVNSSVVSVSTLREIGLMLVDIHGQHEHQKLLDPATHLGILDSYAGAEIAETKEKVAVLYAEMKDMERRHKELKALAADAVDKRDEYTAIKDEIGNAKLEPYEDEKLEKREKLMMNSEKLFGYIDGAYSLLYGAQRSVSETLSEAMDMTVDASEIDESLKGAAESLSQAAYSVEDAVMTIRDYRDSLEFDPDELESIHARLSLINRLKRKYGETIQDILSYYDEIQARLSDTDNISDKVKEAETAYKTALKAYSDEADILYEKRQKAAWMLSDGLCRELKDLAMPNTAFEVRFTPLDVNRYSADGKETAEFYISANAGQALMPLSKSASGGEISRIMLALKTILAGADDTPTLIFDEIDTGISGRTAQMAAEKIARLSCTHQVICITHLSQLAGMAGNHIRISKSVRDGMTFTSVNTLDDDARVEEISRILGGVTIDDVTKAHARQLLDQAKEFRDKLDE